MESPSTITGVTEAKNKNIADALTTMITGLRKIAECPVSRINNSKADWMKGVARATLDDVAGIMKEFMNKEDKGELEVVGTIPTEES